MKANIKGRKYCGTKNKTTRPNKTNNYDRASHTLDWFFWIVRNPVEHPTKGSSSFVVPSNSITPH